jgi:hypothetical protein
MKKKNPKIDTRKYEGGEGKKMYFYPLLKRLAPEEEVVPKDRRKKTKSKKKRKAKN